MTYHLKDSPVSLAKDDSWTCLYYSESSPGQEELSQSKWRLAATKSKIETARSNGRELNTAEKDKRIMVSMSGYTCLHGIYGKKKEETGSRISVWF